MATKGVVRAAAYSTSIAAAAAGTPQRGSVHSVFAAAANIVFPGPTPGRLCPPDSLPQGALHHPPDARSLRYTSPPDGFVLSLNAIEGPQMPNGLRLSVPAGAFPFAALRPGMSVLFGAQRLHIEAIECSIDLSTCPQWNSHIHHPAKLDRLTLESNGERLAAIWNNASKPLSPMSDPTPTPWSGYVPDPTLGVPDPCPGYVPHPTLGVPYPTPGHPQGVSLLYDAIIPPFARIAELTGEGTVYRRDTPCGCPGVGWGTCPGVGWGTPNAGWGTWWGTCSGVEWGNALAQSLCGRGVGLTPTGDDMLAGWMAVGWLLYGATSEFLGACQQIVEVARQQTHLLSCCWLGYAAQGDVALPIVALLAALAGDGENAAQLGQAAQAVLAMGATSGYDVIAGILLGLNMYLDLASPC